MDPNGIIFKFLAVTNLLHLALVFGVGFLLKKKVLRAWRLGTHFALVNVAGALICMAVFPLYSEEINQALSKFRADHVYVYQPMLFFPGSWAYIVDRAWGFHVTVFQILRLQGLEAYPFVQFAFGPVFFGLLFETPILVWIGRMITNWKNEGATDHCHVCEHDFSDLDEITECPECGAPLAEDVIEGREYDRTRAGRHQEEGDGV